MKNIILLISLLLFLVSCNRKDNETKKTTNLKQKPANIITPKANMFSNNTTNTIRKTIHKTEIKNRKNKDAHLKTADKSGVQHKVNIFCDTINISLLSNEEIKKIIENAIANKNDEYLFKLSSKLMVNRRIDMGAILSSALVERAQTDIEKVCALAWHGQMLSVLLFKNNKEAKPTSVEYKEANKVLNDALEYLPDNCMDGKVLSKARTASKALANNQLFYENNADIALDTLERFRKKAEPFAQKDIEETMERPYNYIYYKILQQMKDKRKEKLKISQKNIKKMRDYASNVSSTKNTYSHPKIKYKADSQSEMLKTINDFVKWQNKIK